MKKLLFSSVLVFSILSFSPINEKAKHKNNTTVTENVACKYGQCEATAQSTGEQCKHCVSNKGDKYCWQHK